MLFVLVVLTVGYFAAVVWVRRSVRRSRPVFDVASLPAEDQPPASAVGWPPGGSAFTPYVNSGFRALTAYLSEDRAA